MKEYELLYKYQYPEGSVEGPFDVVSMAIYTKQVNILDLDKSRAQINEVFDYLVLRKRYDLLVADSNSKLLFNHESFILEGHEFQTLDEIEHALKNKAFL